MGLFWADDSPSLQHATAPPISPDAKPPPQCPMHKQSTTSPPMSPQSSTKPSPTSSKDSGCPYQPPATTPSKTQRSSPSSTIAALNPLNYMPSNLSSTPESSTQIISLPSERETSSILRRSTPSSPAIASTSASESNWIYPSPQQMYNALLRKGHADTDPTAVPAMVSVHNFLNEGAWAEIREWERRFAPGLAHGWHASQHGEAGSRSGAMMLDEEAESYGGIYEELGYERAERKEPVLLRFEGRKDDMTPKARMWQVMGWAWPGRFASEAPFDRHDWYVQRLQGGEVSPRRKEIDVTETTPVKRYVIDYYSGPPEPTGEPVFYLDIRPAIDSPKDAAARLIRWGRDVWWRASGGETRLKSGPKSLWS
ncbi:MAG: holocytochrome c synthase [Chrysothrix sp. TS-e1954]|nr:MAG: holocytochrome c synthase [Chrysothrix sp. TS-e1954]